MRVQFLVPATQTMRNGNTVTSERWRSFMEGLGHEVVIDQDACRAPCDLLVAFNAYRNRSAVIEARRSGVARKVVICLTGTDLYVNFQEDPSALNVLYLADQLVVLHPLALSALPLAVRSKTTVIYQSAIQPRIAPVTVPDGFLVCVIAHLRQVKDPLRAAKAARTLPLSSKIKVLHVGSALTEEFACAAKTEVRENPRFHWFGEQSREQTAGILLRSRVLVLSSTLEGGANVVSEAIVSGIPVIVTRIPCMQALLGDDYPGFFPVMDTEKLAGLLLRAESDAGFYQELCDSCKRVAYKFDPSLEQDNLMQLIAKATS